LEIDIHKLVEYISGKLGEERGVYSLLRSRIKETKKALHIMEGL